jgi:hypothetical protein
MPTFTETPPALASRVNLTTDSIEVELQDGRRLSVPLTWYPRLAHGSPAERADWRLIGRGIGIHWPALDEDISVAGLLAGLPSGESARSLKEWLALRKRAPNKALQPARRARHKAKSQQPSRAARG